jgi:hypothetical protein
MKTAEEKNQKALRRVRYDAPARGHTRGGLDVLEEAARPSLPSLEMTFRGEGRRRHSACSTCFQSKADCPCGSVAW